jgi:cation transport ATPase
MKKFIAVVLCCILFSSMSFASFSSRFKKTDKLELFLTIPALASVGVNFYNDSFNSTLDNNSKNTMLTASVFSLLLGSYVLYKNIKIFVTNKEIKLSCKF